MTSPRTLPVTVAYLGPAGTFTETAARRMPGAEVAALHPYASVGAALDAVRTGTVDAAVVPWENSVEGSVNATLDQLVRGAPLQITAEVPVPVEFTLMAPAGTDVADIARVLTHPVAEAQCRRWLATHLPDVEVTTTTSTAAAAAEVAEVAAAAHAGRSGAADAAIAAPAAAGHYGLAALASDIGENSDAVTRFVRVQRLGRCPEPTGADKTTVVAYLRSDQPGALLELLEQLATRGVNLSRIHSRPTGEGPYCFVLDALGHLEDLRVGEALMGLRRVCREVRFLGSYPSADGVLTPVETGTTDADFTDAARWLNTLRDVDPTDPGPGRPGT